MKTRNYNTVVVSSVETNEPNEPKAVKPASTTSSLEIVDYSEKAIAVFGDTKEIKEQLKEIGGRFNPSLKYNGGKRAGWIFSKKQADKVRELVMQNRTDVATVETETPYREINAADLREDDVIIKKSGRTSNVVSIDRQTNTGIFATLKDDESGDIYTISYPKLETLNIMRLNY